MNPKLRDDILLALGSIYTGKQTHAQRESYQDAFVSSGERKALNILEDLQSRRYDLARIAYLSVGGADGSEIETIMSRSPVNYGVLLEYDDIGVARARQRADKLREREKHLEVMQGDATLKIDGCMQHLTQLRENGRIDGLVVSIQAVLHELSNRSPGFDLNYFLARIFRGWDLLGLYCREPCAPTGWSKRVEFKFDTLSGTNLCAITRIVKNHLGFEGPVEDMGDNFVACSAELAVETMVKLFYFEDFYHEIEEKWTSIDPHALTSLLGKYFDNPRPRVWLEQSDSFYRLFNHHVRARDAEGHPLDVPQCFLRIVAFRDSPAMTREDAVYAVRKRLMCPDSSPSQVFDPLTSLRGQSLYEAYRALIDAAQADLRDRYGEGGIDRTLRLAEYLWILSAGQT